MFKIIARITAILLVTALVAGGMYALVQNGGTGSRAFASSDRQFNGQNLNTNAGQPLRFRGERGFGGGASLGRGLAGTLVTLLQIGLISFVVIQIRKSLAKSPKPAPTSPA